MTQGGSHRNAGKPPFTNMYLNAFKKKEEGNTTPAIKLYKYVKLHFSAV